MKVSLNKANKIRNQLETILTEKYIGFRTDTSIDLNGYETPSEIQSKIDSSFATQQENFNGVIDLADVIYELRGMIQQANATLGINEIIGQLAKTEELIKTLANLSLPTRLTMVSATDMATANKDYRAVAPTARSLSLPFGHVSTVNPNVQISVAVLAKKLKKDSQTLQESRNELNHSKWIELPDSMVEVLSEYDLM